MTDSSAKQDVEKLGFCLLCGFDGMLQDHHVSYHPEITIPVCDACHDNIHNKDGFMNHLQPDDKPDRVGQLDWKYYKYGGEKYS